MARITVTGWEITPDTTITIKYLDPNGIVVETIQLPDYEASDEVFEVEDFRPGEMITIEFEG